MLKMINNGELVYVPSQVRLCRYFDTARGMQVKDFLVLDEPRHLLVVENNDSKEIGVNYNGETWYVSKRDIYGEAAND
tara:strand:+ start:849 stop:1082 length:234 start_codon:yes stop_codon:yes gene_type:complete